jgi:hypothetical protein
MKKPPKASKVQAERITRAATLMAPYATFEAVFWAHLPETFEVVWGVPLDMADQHHVMLCQAVAFETLKAPLSNSL